MLKWHLFNNNNDNNNVLGYIFVMLSQASYLVLLILNKNKMKAI